MNGLDSIVINFPQVQLWQSVTSITAPSPRGAAASPPPPACGWRLRAARSPSPGDAASALRLCSPRACVAAGTGSARTGRGGGAEQGAGAGGRWGPPRPRQTPPLPAAARPPGRSHLPGERWPKGPGRRSGPPAPLAPLPLRSPPSVPRRGPLSPRSGAPGWWREARPRAGPWPVTVLVTVRPAQLPSRL